MDYKMNQTKQEQKTTNLEIFIQEQEQEQEIVDPEETITNLESINTHLEYIIVEQEERILALEDDVGEKEQKILNLNAIIRETKQKITDLNAIITEVKQNKNKEWKSYINKHKQEANLLHSNQMTQIEQLINETLKQFKTTTLATTQMEDQLKQLYQSTDRVSSQLKNFIIWGKLNKLKE